MWTMDAIREANAKSGHYWFSPDTMRFFSSRVGETVYQGAGGIFFVSSEQFTGLTGEKKPRSYTVRRFNPETGDVGTALGVEFNTLTRSQAVSLARKFAGAVRAQDRI
jgi:hypothetical protein